MTTQIAEPEITETETQSLSLPKFPMGRLGPSPDQRASAKHREPLEEAEAAAELAREKADEIRQTLADRQIRIESLTHRRDELAGRLGRLQRRDLAAEKKYCENVVIELLESQQADDIYRRRELTECLQGLADIESLSRLLPGIIKGVKADLAEVEKALAAEESSK